MERNANANANRGEQAGYRLGVSHSIAFKPRNKAEFKAIFEELIFLDRDTGEALQRYVFDRPHAFLFASAETSSLFKNFDRLLVKEKNAQQVEVEVEVEVEEGKGKGKAKKDVV